MDSEILHARTTILVCALLALLCTPAPAERHDPGEFSGIDWSFFPDSGCTEVDRWVEVTLGNTTTVDPGTSVYLQDVCTIDHCDDECPCEECDPPNPATYSCSASVNFSKSKSYEVTGGIEGSAGWLIADLKAKLELAVNWANSVDGTFTRSASATLDYCEWQRYRTYLNVTQGKTVSISAQIQPCGRQNCDGNIMYDSGASVNGSVTGTFDVAFAGDGGIGLDSHGDCPPDPGA